jgi:hypothetical protein
MVNSSSQRSNGEGGSEEYLRCKICSLRPILKIYVRNSLEVLIPVESERIFCHNLSEAI